VAGAPTTNFWESAIAVERTRLLAHPVYQALRGPEEVVVFLQHHVWAVWDFMSLLKALQTRLTCVRVPWVPGPHPFAARLINEIVLGEETDEDGEGGHASHFELYLKAMAEAGADVGPIERYVDRVSRGMPWTEVLETGEREIPPAARGFVAHHLRLAESGSLAEVAGAFTLAREGVIPDMFNRLLLELGESMPDRFGRFGYYLRRHIELDGDEHGPAATRLLDCVTGGNPAAENEAIEAARVSLGLRANLYDAVFTSIRAG
jgi:hypothetical protein